MAKILLRSAFLTLILTLNNFKFNDEHFIQINGVSTKCAPTYATLFMGKFEETYILPNIKENILQYSRYIDDIFFIRFGSQVDLIKAADHLNSLHPTIKFDIKYSREKIIFLDTTVIITNESKLKTTTYNKPMDEKSYLHAKSYHPESTKKAIPYSQSLRLKRICSDDADYKENNKILLNKLVERGYQLEDTKKNIDKTHLLKREELLKYKEKTPRNSLLHIVDKCRT